MVAHKTFIAAVNGSAAGVGLAFALACDIIIASERAVLVPAFGRLGLVPEVGTSWLLTRRLGYQGALALYVRGGHIEAEEALRLGLVQEVRPPEEAWPSRCSLIRRRPYARADVHRKKEVEWQERPTRCFSRGLTPSSSLLLPPHVTSTR